MSTKAMRQIAVKDADKGQIEAVFATFDVVDSDGDITLAGAFEEGGEVTISAYGHKSWEGLLPVGKGTIHSTQDEAILRGQFFMNTAAGRDTFETVKQLGPLGQWSYGYDPVSYSFGERDGRKVRFLKQILTHEVSPVLLGAGVNTRTLSAKAGHREEPTMSFKTAIRPHTTDVVNRAWDRGEVVSAIPDGASVSDLRSVAAWVDPGEDPESKSAYRFWHHHGVKGPANVRACIAGIAALNGARGGADVPDAERQSVYEHLASHLRDADREPPELRSRDATVKLDLRDEIAATLVGVSAAVDSASRVVALRAAKGKTLSKVNAEYLDWLDEDLMALHRKLRSFIDSPDDDAVREYARYIRNSIGGQQP